MKDIRFALLVEGWVHGELDEAGQRQLWSSVRDDPRRRAFLADQGNLHAMLVAHHADAHAGEQLVSAVRRRLDHGRVRSGGRAFRRWLPLLAAGLLVAVGVAVYTSSEAGAPAVVLRRDGRTLEPETTSPWRSGDELRATAAGTVSLPGGATATLAPGSRLVWDGPGALRLQDGTASFAVRPRSGSDFRVTTAHTVCSVLGTRFTVRTIPTATMVAVDEGRVALDDGRNLIPGQQTWRFDETAIDAWLADLPRRPAALATLPQRTRLRTDAIGPWQGTGALRQHTDASGYPVLSCAGSAQALYSLPNGLDGGFLIRVRTAVIDDDGEPNQHLRLSIPGMPFRRREPVSTDRNITGTTIQELRFSYRGRHHLTDWWEFEQRVDGAVALRGFAYGRPQAIALHLNQVTIRVEAVEVAVADR